MIGKASSHAFHLSLLNNRKSSLTSTSPVSTSCKIKRLEIGPGVSEDNFKISLTRTSVRPKNSEMHKSQSKHAHEYASS